MIKLTEQNAGLVFKSLSKQLSKYGNKKTEYLGDIYDSKKEADFAKQLDLMKHAKGRDRVLRYYRQIPYKLEVNGQLICTYILDFLVEYFDGRKEFIDVKGVRTDIYKIKKKLLKALYNIDILEV